MAITYFGMHTSRQKDLQKSLEFAIHVMELMAMAVLLVFNNFSD